MRANTPVYVREGRLGALIASRHTNCVPRTPGVRKIYIGRWIPPLPGHTPYEFAEARS